MLYNAVMVAREEDFTDKILKPDGKKNRLSLVSYIDENVNDLLSRWALLGMLSGYERYLNTMRDSVLFDPKHRAKPQHLLEGLRSHFSQSVDISAISIELQDLAESHHLFELNTNDFRMCYRPLNKVDNPTLSKVLRDHIKERAGWIRNIDRSFRDILTQYGTALGIRENIKLQKRISRLTWVIVVLTIMIMFLTAITTFVSIEAKHGSEEKVLIDGEIIQS